MQQVHQGHILYARQGICEGQEYVCLITPVVALVITEHQVISGHRCVEINVPAPVTVPLSISMLVSVWPNDPHVL